MDSSNSPFQKKSSETIFRREKSLFEKSWERIHSYAADLFLAFIPSDDIKQMPPFYMYLFGGMLILALMAIFIGLFVNGYQSSAGQKFLSPLLNSVNPASYCETIPVSNSGLFRASNGGIWEGQDNFDFSTAIYAIQVTNYEMEYYDYQLIMSTIYEDLLAIGNAATMFTLDINMLFWLTYAYVSPTNTVQRFQLLGDPLVVFTRQQYVGSFGNINGTCNVTRSSSFDISSGSLISVFRASDYMNSAACMDCGPLSYFDYLPGTNSDSFSVAMDVRTLSTCVAINSRLIQLGDLVEIKVFGSNESFAGIDLYMSTYYLPKYPSMRPMICISNTSYDLVMCTVHLTPSLFVLPIFNHLGNNTEYPQRCECSQMTDGEKTNPFSACNLFRFLAGFLYFSADFPTNLEYLVTLALKYRFDLYHLNRDTFNASFISSYFGQNSTYSATFETPTYRESAFDFCRINGTTCKIMIVSVFDTIQYNWAITEYYFQLPMGACQNTFTIPPDKWALLVETPFAPLVQSYQSCGNSESVIWLTQLGVQVGNVSAVTPLCVILMLLLIGLYQRLFGVDIPMGYTKKEKEEALDALAISLLLARDRRTIEDENERRRIRKITGGRLAVANDDDIESNFGLDSEELPVPKDGAGMNRTLSSVSNNHLWPSKTIVPDRTVTFSQHQENLMRQIVLSLEQDAVYHQDVYRLRQELVSQQIGRKKKRKKTQSTCAEDDSWMNWQLLRTLFGRQTKFQSRCQDTNVDAETDDGFSDAGSMSESVGRSESINPLQSASILGTPSRTVSVFDGNEKHNSIQLVSLDRKRYVASAATRSRLAAGVVRILNEQKLSSVSSQKHRNVLVSIPTLVTTISLLTKTFEALARDMEESSGGEVDQNYWSLLGEVNTTVSDISLPGRVMYLLAIESDNDTTEEGREALGAQEKTQLRSLVWPLGRLLAVHGLCTSNMSMSQLEAVLGESEVERSETQRRYVSVWAYRLRGEVVVTLAELLHLREQLVEDSDDDDDDDNNNDATV